MFLKEKHGKALKTEGKPLFSNAKPQTLRKTKKTDKPKNNKPVNTFKSIFISSSDDQN